MSTSTGTTIETTIADFYTTILARTGSAAEIQSWVSVVNSGALTLAQVENAFIASPEAQQDVVPIVEIYQAELGRAPDAAGLAAWVGLEESGTSLAQIAADIANSAEGQAFYGASTTVNVAFLTALYQTALGRAPDTAGLNAWLNSGLTRAQIEYAFATSSEAVARATPAADAFLASVSQGGAYGGSLYASAPGGTVTLTPGQDNIALTGNNNVVNGTYNGSASTTPSTFTAGDTIKGAAGSTGNVLNLADIGGSGIGPSNLNPTNLAGVTVSGIQTLNINSTEAVIANTATSIEGFTGLTALNIQDAGGSNVTAAGTAAVSVNDLAAKSASETVLGGSNDTVTADGVTTGGAITVGSTAAAPTGTITVTANDANTSDPGAIGSSITTTGGTTVNITQNIQAPVSGFGTNVSAGGAVTVNGTATTTDVTVNQTAPVPVTGVAAVTETAAITFAAGGLLAGQSLTIAGLTFTAGVGGATQPQVEAAFANLAAGTAGNSLTSANGTFSGTLTGWSTGAVTGNAITATNTTGSLNAPLLYTDDRNALASVTITNPGQAAVPETNTITFLSGGLLAGQSLTIGGLTFTAAGVVSQLQLVNVFAGLSNGATSSSPGLLLGAFSGTLAGWNLSPSTGNVITATNTTGQVGSTLIPVTDTNLATSVAPATPGQAFPETAAITFAAGGLVAGQALTIAGLTFTAGTLGATQAQVEAAFASLAAGTAGSSLTSAIGTFSGTLTGWSTSAVNGSTITATNTTGSLNAPLLYTDYSSALANVTETQGVPPVTGVGGIADGHVTITDANGSSTTKGGTITSVSLSNYSQGATITDNALANLTLAGTGGGVVITDNLTTPTATTLALALNGLTDATGITDANHEITTLNVTTGGTSASTLDQFVDSGLTTLNVSGTQAFNLGISPSTLTAINVSGGASLSNGPGAGYALGVNTAFTSTSTGTDVVEISGPTTKTVTGNGSVNEEIVWNGNAAPAAATGYLGNVKGFSVLGLGSAVTSETFDLSKLTGFTGFDVEGNTNSSTITLANVTAGSPLAIDNTFNGTLVYQTADSSGATDSLGVTLGAAANPAGFNVNALTAEDSKSVGIGTLTLTSNTSGTSGLAFDSITTLTDSSLSTLNVAGTGGLLIGSGLTTGATSLTINGTSTGALPITILGVNDTALTTLNLSGTDAIALGTIKDGTAGITVNGSADNANVSFALAGATASGKTDSITLGNGTENISDLNAVTGATVNITVGNGGTSTNANNISVGAANSTIMAGSGVNTISAGNGNNTITVGGGGGSIDVGNGNNTISAGNGAEAIIVGSGNNTITAGSGGDTISVGAGLNAITVGAGADTLNFTTGNNGSGSIYSTITGAQAGDTLNFTAGGGFGTTLAQVTGASTTSFATLLSDAAAASTGAAGDMGWFQYSGNTYVVDNVNANAAFGTGDYVVGLAGLHNLTTGATVSGSGTTDTLTLGSHFA